MLSQDQLEEFDRTGLLRLPAAIPAEDTAAMRDRIWSFLRERDGIERDTVSSWPVGPVAGFQRLSQSVAFDAIDAVTVSAAIDDLLEKGQWRRGPCGVLMTFPQPDTVWTVPTSAWHLDFPPPVSGSLTAVRLFAILDDLEARGGGTLVLTGSHRLAKKYVASSGREPHSRTIKLALGAAHQWLAELWDSDKSSDRDASSRIRRCMYDGAIVDDVPVIVSELHGAAGDVFLMHSDCFHTVASNSLERPRIMLTTTPSRDRNSAL